MLKNSLHPDGITRRTLLKCSAGGVFSMLPITRALADVLSELSPDTMVTIEEFTPDGNSSGVRRAARVVKTDSEWRAILPADSYRVARLGEPDHPYTGDLWNAHKAGIYRCLCCDTALFDSKCKFESGTGWTSFWQPISALNIRRGDGTFTCTRCAAHLGLVIADGPEPTGLRFSAYTLTLKFEART